MFSKVCAILCIIVGYCLIGSAVMGIVISLDDDDFLYSYLIAVFWPVALPTYIIGKTCVGIYRLSQYITDYIIECLDEWGDKNRRQK